MNTYDAYTTAVSLTLGFLDISFLYQRKCDVRSALCSIYICLSKKIKSENILPSLVRLSSKRFRLIQRQSEKENDQLVNYLLLSAICSILWLVSCTRILLHLYWASYLSRTFVLFCLCIFAIVALIGLQFWFGGSRSSCQYGFKFNSTTTSYLFVTNIESITTSSRWIPDAISTLCVSGLVKCFDQLSRPNNNENTIFRYIWTAQICSLLFK